MPSLQPSPLVDFLPDKDFPVSVFFGAGGDGGIKETMWSDRGMEVSIDFLIPWKNRIPFLYLLRGSCGYDGSDYWRRLPISLPDVDFDSVAILGTDEESEDYRWNRYFCSSIGELRPIKPMTSDEDGEPTGQPGWPYYSQCVVPTKWTVPLYWVSDDFGRPGVVGIDPSGFPYTVTKWRTAGEIFSPYTNSYRFESETTPANEANVGILRCKTELSITRVFMPCVDTLALDGMIGKVNKDEIQIGSDKNPPGSMLYLGYETEPYVNPANANLVWDVTHRIMVNGAVIDDGGNPIESWNYFLNRAGKWDKLVLRTDATKGVYDETEFACRIWPEYLKCP